jgi:hypothetical protein
MPALFTSTSRRLNARTVSATAPFTACASPESARIAIARRPPASIARTTSSAFGCALA